MHATNSRLPATRRSHHAMGFSLIELLMVIAIIVVIIAITVPALASGKAAKRSETANLLTDLSQGVAQFTLDEKRQPGYFTVGDGKPGKHDARHDNNAKRHAGHAGWC